MKLTLWGKKKDLFGRIVTVIKSPYDDVTKSVAYENACDCIMYGYGKSYWNAAGLEETTANEVWNQAIYDMAGHN